MKKNNCTHSKVIVHPASIEMLANATWDFAKQILWSKVNFGEEEILLSQSYIREHYEEISPENFQKKSFIWFENYCKRIIAAKGNYCYEFTHPCIWFNKFNPHGFSKSVVEHRREMQERYGEDISFFMKLRKDPIMSELLNNDYSHKPIKPNLNGDRSY
ncbi:MAG: hypothetical protein ACT4ON_08720 [Bacteroidota bacterium]